MNFKLLSQLKGKAIY